jgi:ergothioneine biosynthesis protein EgtB
MSTGDLPLLDRYERVRRATVDLSAALTPEDCQAQSMEPASPVKWHLAHTTWFFDTFVLGRAGSSEQRLFNSYYETLGEHIARDRRGLLTRPSLDDVLAYRRRVDEEIVQLLGRRDGASQDKCALVELGLHHEQQHQELILTDVKHLFFSNPLGPAYLPEGAPEPRRHRTALRLLSYPGGLVDIGQGDEAAFAFDNERPRHRRFLEPFKLGSRLVTCGEFLGFIEEDGYRRPELWLSDGWAEVLHQRWTCPLYWSRSSDGWAVFTLFGSRALDPEEPVCHVSYYEADAFARWAGARLPCEEEWEVVARDCAPEGNMVGSGGYHPRGIRPGSASDLPLQLFGDVWEWTRSAYAPYPGYRAPAGPLGEYNSKFMCNQFVLRGGSCGTPVSHIRATYRNYFPPSARWQFTGIRLAE